jgi:hypothetical protein
MTRNSGPLTATLLLVLALVFVLQPAAIAEAEEFSCPPPIPPNAVITDKLIVPAGQTCTITTSEIRGNIEVGPGAVLIIAGGTLRGNIECSGNAAVLLAGVVVTGNIDGCIVA